MKSLWWIKRDIRLVDNEALCRAILSSDQVLPVFVFEPSIMQAEFSSAFHFQAQWQALKDLQKRLIDRGGNLLVAQGEVVDVFVALKKVYDFTAIYSHEETGTYLTFERDLVVKKLCHDQQILWHEFYQNGVIRRLKSRDDRNPIIDGRLFKTPVFSIPKDLKFPAQFLSVCQEKIWPQMSDFYPDAVEEDLDLQVVSESQAFADFDDFLTNRGYHYSGGISSPNTAFEACSRLSPHLAWGTISLRTVFQQTVIQIAAHKKLGTPESKKWARSLRAFMARLHWHCHFIQRLESASDMEFRALNPAYENLKYTDDPARLKAWLEGKTGFPLVDACMRCLQSTGYLNFRMRAFVVSFAIFGLNLSWKDIQYELARLFLDFEPGIHFSQIQMQAGIVGINTIRVYSPKKQILDQDAECKFIKRWVEELAPFSAAEITEYEKANLGSYPHPIVDFDVNCRSMKDQIFAIRKSSFGKESAQKVLKSHGSRKVVKKKKKTNTQPTLW